MKKYVLASVVGMLVTSVSANQGSIYGGPLIGVGATSGKFDANYGDGEFARHHKIGHTSFLGGLVLGYAYTSQKLLLGLEVLGTLDTARSRTIVAETNTTFNESFKFKKGASYGFSARLGYRTPSDTVLFIRLGGEWSTHKLSYYGIRTTTGVTNAASRSVTKFAFVPGLGIEVPLKEKWKARLEAKYSFPQKIRVAVPDKDAFYYDNTRPRTQTGQTSVLVGVTYTFN